MIVQILDLTRSRLGGGIPIERRTITLNDVVTAAVRELQQVYPSRQICCVLAPGVRGDWDPERLAQVVSNLVGNALQYGDPVRPVEVRLATQERVVTLAVQSFGPPIAPELLPVLFEPYRRGTTSPGLGLGLFISNQIVRAHGGCIDVTSTLEDGTTFRVTLPRSEFRSAPIGAHARVS